MGKPRSRPASDVPLFGREQLLDRLVRSVDRGEHLLLTGGSGIGKTRLAQEILNVADRRIERVLASPATEGDRLGTLAALGCPSGIAPHDVGALFQWYLGRWNAMSSRNRAAVLWVDDIHHTDDLSAAVIRTAVSRGVVQLLATARTPMPRPADTDALVVEGLVTATDTPQLDPDASVRLVEWASPHPRRPDEVAAICELGDGYPMYLRELARQDDPTVRPLDEDLQVLVARQIRDLDPVHLRTARLVAAAEPVPTALLHDQRDALRHLVEVGLVVHHQADSLRISHPLLAALLREHVGAETYLELARRADESDIDVDPVAHATWWINAGTRPDPQLAERTIRAALARSDAAGARRLVAFVGDDRLHLDGQVLMAEGHIDRAVSMLESARRRAVHAHHRIEAATVLARHYGLTLGDAAAADRLLADIETTELDLHDRRQLYSARAWVWIFGRNVTAPDLDVATTLMSEPPLDASAYEIALDSACVAGFSGSTLRAKGFVDQWKSIERDPAAEIADEARVRAVCVHAQYLCADGRLSAAVDDLRSTLEDTGRERITDRAILGGNLAHYGSIAGCFDEARDAAAEVVRSAAGIDWYRYGRLAELVLAGIHALPGFNEPTEVDIDIDEVASTFDAVFAMRAYVLRAQRSGSDVADAPLLDFCRSFAQNGRIFYPVALSVEIFDLRTSRAAHELIAAAIPESTDAALLAIARQAANARLAGDAQKMIATARSYEAAAFLQGAARAYADVVRLDPGPQLVHDARCGIVRCDRRAEGRGHLLRVAAVDGLPSGREIDVAWEVLQAGSVTAAASRLNLAKRTVENHLYRCCRALGLSGQAELEAAMELTS